jgi:hypothetical protein
MQYHPVIPTPTLPVCASFSQQNRKSMSLVLLISQSMNSYTLSPSQDMIRKSMLRHRRVEYRSWRWDPKTAISNSNSNWASLGAGRLPAYKNEIGILIQVLEVFIAKGERGNVLVKGNTDCR